MRKHLIWVLGLVVVFAAVAIAQAVPNTQTITGKAKPKKLSKSKRSPISLNTNVEATNSDPARNGVPYPTTNAEVDFDKDIKFQQKGYPTCDTSGFGAATTIQDVKDECSDSILGSGSATVEVPLGAGVPPTVIPAQVIAANVKGNKILLHSQNSLSGGQPLIGQLHKSPKSAGKKYGTTLSVPVPPLAGGSAVITQFQTLIKKIAYKFHGKKRAIISAKCGKDKKFFYQARFTDDQGQLAVGKNKQKCKQKKH